MIQERVDELKWIIWPTIIIIIAFGLIVFVWFHSDMYRDEMASIKLQVQTHLINTYYTNDVPEETRAEWMEKYSLTDDDVNPHKILQNAIKTTQEAVND